MKPPHPGSWHIGNTWLEPEDLCYPNGGYHRRCRAMNADTGKLVIVRCSIADTFFSIPAAGGGWVGSGDDGFIYHPPRKDRKDD